MSSFLVFFTFSNRVDIWHFVLLIAICTHCSKIHTSTRKNIESYCCYGSPQIRFETISRFFRCLFWMHYSSHLTTHLMLRLIYYYSLLRWLNNNCQLDIVRHTERERTQKLVAKSEICCTRLARAHTTLFSIRSYSHRVHRHQRFAMIWLWIWWKCQITRSVRLSLWRHTCNGASNTTSWSGWRSWTNKNNDMRNHNTIFHGQFDGNIYSTTVVSGPTNCTHHITSRQCSVCIWMEQIQFEFIG